MMHDKKHLLLDISLVIGALLLLVWTLGSAQAATTFSASVTSANGSLSTVLTWNSDRDTCTASGHPSWTGAKAKSGTLNLPAITTSGTYTLKLVCTTPGDTKAALKWVNPTTNTDGTPYTNPAGVRIYYGTSANALNQTIEVAHPGNTRDITGLAPGRWYFAVAAYSAAGLESARSNTVSKLITAAVSEEDTVTLTVNPIPAAPSGFVVE